MASIFWLLLRTTRSALKARRNLVLENLALRHQLVVLQRQTKRPRLFNSDRTLWILLYNLWRKWMINDNYFSQRIASS
ncbi:MAG: hypothetical protein ACE5JX_03845 [Acidobacteriota bacterium]